MKRLLSIALTVLTALAAFSAFAAPPLAVVNGVEVPAAVLDAALAQAQGRGVTVTDEVRRQVRDQVLAEELMWQRAQAAGLDRSPGVQAAVERARRQAAIEAYVATQVKPVVPTERAIRARYDDIVARLGAHEYRLSLIQTPDEAALREAAAQLAKGAEFSTVARRSSRVPSAARGGELDWISFRQPVRDGDTNGLPTPIAQAVLTLAPGQISAPIALGESWALVRLDAVRPTLVPEYGAVRAQLSGTLAVQDVEAQSKALVIELLRNAQIRILP